MPHDILPLGDGILSRMAAAVREVRERLERAVSALEAGGVAYCVVGGHAVAAWVSRVDPGAARVTPDVNILLRRADLASAIDALEAAGFFYQRSTTAPVFLDGPEAKPREAVQILFAGEKVKPDHLIPAPDLSESEVGPRFRLLSLEALVRMKLTSYRLKDQVHLQDILEVGLIDAGWLTRFAPEPELVLRLQDILDNPHT